MSLRVAAGTMSLLFTTALLGAESPKIMLVMHGGAGTILRKNMTPELDQQYRAAMAQALRAGYDALKAGGSSLDAVEKSIRILEDNPLFNAGKGAVFTHDGRNELDAAIMDGKDKRAGSVAGVTIIRNPISAARAVMEKSPHVMMTGKGAELFATRVGLEIVDPSYFWTERRWKELQQELMQESGKKSSSLNNAPIEEKKYGTVGAAALDGSGNLAAGTSTGGISNKQYGRVGDSPIIGAGTYADNASCAISATGQGEFFIRYTVASEISALMKYKGMSAQAAADEVIQRRLKPINAEGGVIVLDHNGNHAFSFNSEGMYRGYIGPDGVPHVFIYGDE
jgi:L-asparaginase / beta-aspartyl-peptidase